MNDRFTALLLIAVALAAYGLYIAAYVPAMLVGQPVPLLVIGFVLELRKRIAQVLAIVLGLYLATSGHAWLAFGIWVVAAGGIACSRMLSRLGTSLSLAVREGSLGPLV